MSETIQTSGPAHATLPLVSKDHGWVRWAWGITLASAVATAITVPLCGPWAVLPGVLTVVAFIVALPGWLHWRYIRRWLIAFRQGNYLVHWTYTREEWDSFLDIRLQEDHVRRKGLIILGVLLGMASGAGWGIAMADKVEGRGTGKYLLLGGGWALLGCVAGAVTGCLLIWQLHGRAVASARRQRGEAVGEAYIGINSVFCDGRCWTWFGAFSNLESLERVPGNLELLRFTFRNQTGQGYALVSFLVPIPASRVHEAEEVLRVYNGQVPPPEVSWLFKAREARMTGNSLTAPV